MDDLSSRCATCTTIGSLNCRSLFAKDPRLSKTLEDEQSRSNDSDCGQTKARPAITQVPVSLRVTIRPQKYFRSRKNEWMISTKVMIIGQRREKDTLCTSRASFRTISNFTFRLLPSSSPRRLQIIQLHERQTSTSFSRVCLQRKDSESRA